MSIVDASYVIDGKGAENDTSEFHKNGFITIEFVYVFEKYDFFTTVLYFYINCWRVPS